MSDTASACGDCCSNQTFVQMEQLPPVVKGRVNALKNLQLDTVKAESDFYDEVHLLDMKYAQRFGAITTKRAAVLSGAHEPSGAEIEWKEDIIDPEEELENEKEEVSMHPDFTEDCKGIPKFWSHVLRNANEDALMGLIEEGDEAALAYLSDLSVKVEQKMFTLSFLFEDNPFFTNSILTKTYFLRPGPDPESPLEYDGPEIVRCEGCTISWKDGQDLTKKMRKVKTLAGRRKKGSSSPVKTVTKEIKADSFFNFFNPPLVKDDGELENDDDQAVLTVDFEVGFSLKEKVVPKAVLYFTGDIFGDDEDFEDCEDESEDED